jgi:hypothetical protein
MAVGLALLTVGAVLSLLGIGVVIFEIDDAERAVKVRRWFPATADALKSWGRRQLQKVGIVKPGEQQLMGVSLSSSLAVSANISMKVEPGPDAGWDEWRKELARRIDQVDAHIDRVIQGQDKRLGTNEQTIRELKEEVADLRRQIRELGTGSRRWLLIGAALIALGVVGSTAGGWVLAFTSAPFPTH